MYIRIKNLSVRLSLPLVAMMTAIIIFDTTQTILLSCLSAVLHEAGHLAAMYKYRSFPKEIRLSLFDIAIIDSKKGRRSLKQELTIVLAGVFMNLVFAVLTYCIYLLTQSDIMLVAACSNIVLLVYNILPVESLDGGQALYLILTSKLSQKTSQIILEIVSLIILIPTAIFAFYVLLVSKYNFTLLLTTLYLIALVLLKKGIYD